MLELKIQKTIGFDTKGVKFGSASKFHQSIGNKLVFVKGFFVKLTCPFFLLRSFKTTPKTLSAGD